MEIKLFLPLLNWFYFWYNRPMKILSPVGNFESLKVAVSSGADEVYLGINEFNARNNIDGFSLSSLKDAVDYAHIFDVKVNLAINILFKDAELQEAVNTIVESYNMGVDSFIVQDLGLAGLIRKNYPEIELHASTQMGIHNLAGAKWAEEFGFKRIVLARETSLDEIRRIRENTNLEIEYFAQGALCVSFSGNCYMSSYLFDASGNRGRCKQLCRLPFSLVKDGKMLKSGYLLSAKDFMMIDRLNDLKNAGVGILKIEGRARRPFYVGATTRQYYNALHGDKVDKNKIMLGFNRDYTEGYFNGNGEIISSFNNHIGLKVGKVLEVNSGKKFNEVVISSSRELSPKSSFKFFNAKSERGVLTAFDLKQIDKNKYSITTTQKVFVGDDVHLIIDAKQEDEILSELKKLPVEIEMSLKIGKPISAAINLRGESVKVDGAVLQEASNQPLTKEDVVSNFSKHDIFYGEFMFKDFEKVFISKRELNEFRRRVFDAVYKKLTEVRRTKINPVSIKVEKAKDMRFKNFEVISSVDEKIGKNNIVYSPEFYEVDDIAKIKSLVEEKGKKFYLDLPNFATTDDVKLLKSIVDKLHLSIVVNNYYGLMFDAEKVVGAGMNVYNSYSADILGLPVITAESDLGARVNYPYMTLRHCPMKSHLNATCKNCPYCDGFEFVMENGERMKLKRKKISSCTFYLV